MPQISEINAVNNAPQTFFPSQLLPGDVAMTDTYLTDVLLAYPEIKKEMIRAVCEDLSLPLLQRVLGYGRTVSKAELEDTSRMSIAASKIQWTVMPWLRQLLCFCGTPIGNGTNDSNITFFVDDDWASPGMVFALQDGHGNTINVMITSYPVHTGSGCYEQTGKLVTDDPSVVFDHTAFAAEGQCMAWSYDMVAQCGDTSVKIPFRTPAWLENYTTTTMTDMDICSTGIQQMLWIEGVDGSRCYQPWQEFQQMQQFLKSFEQSGWYATSTINIHTGNVNLTDWENNVVQSGAGVLAQVESAGNIAGYDINVTNPSGTGYNNPANYEAFRQFLNDTVISWSVQQGLSQGAELDLWCGINAYALLQDVLFNYMVQPGGCCILRDFESGIEYQAKIGVEIMQYAFAGFKLNLKKCAVFNDPSTQPFVAAGTTTPWEAWKIVAMTDTCNGIPLIQYYSRAGCGTSNAFRQGYIVGTIDPTTPEATNVHSNNHKKGYNVWFNREGVFLLNDPGKCLVFNATPAN